MSAETFRLAFLAVFGTLWAGQVLRASAAENRKQPGVAIVSVVSAMILAYLCILMALA